MTAGGQAKSIAGNSRIEVIDSFRGIAIICVLLFHYTFRWSSQFSSGSPDFYRYPININWFEYGWLGVSFFFIISGFVIFMTIERSNSIFDFAIRRFARLYPTYIICMTITFAVTSLLGVAAFESSFRDYLFGFSMQSIDFGVAWVDGAYWSLLVELKFYFWIAVIFFLFRPRFVFVWSLFVSLISIARLFHPFIVDGIFSGTNLPFFTLGMGYFLRYRNGRITRDAGILFAIAFLTYIAAWYDRPIAVHFFVMVMNAAFIGFIAGKMNWLSHPALLFVGAISYPLYLLHQFIGVSTIARLAPYTSSKEIGVLVILTACIVAMAWAVHVFIEVPAHKKVHAYLKRRKQGGTQVGSEAL